MARKVEDRASQHRFDTSNATEVACTLRNGVVDENAGYGFEAHALIEAHSIGCGLKNDAGRIVFANCGVDGMARDRFSIAAMPEYGSSGDVVEAGDAVRGD